MGKDLGAWSNQMNCGSTTDNFCSTFLNPCSASFLNEKFFSDEKPFFWNGGTMKLSLFRIFIFFSNLLRFKKKVSKNKYLQFFSSLVDSGKLWPVEIWSLLRRWKLKEILLAKFSFGSNSRYFCYLHAGMPVSCYTFELY